MAMLAGKSFGSLDKTLLRAARPPAEAASATISKAASERAGCTSVWEADKLPGSCFTLASLVLWRPISKGIQFALDPSLFRHDRSLKMCHSERRARNLSWLRGEIGVKSVTVR